MALAPARTKYRKVMKGSRAGNAKRGNTLAFGELGSRSRRRELRFHVTLNEKESFGFVSSRISR